MIKSPWFKMPSVWIQNEGLKMFKWNADELGTPAAKIAALQLYYSIALTLEYIEMPGAYDMKITRHVSAATFNRFRTLTGLSRALVSAGIETLERAGLIKRHRQGKRCYYEITGYIPGGGGWCKVPLRKVLGNNGDITPFHQFKLRRKIELYAIKFYLYICAVRDNKTEETYASFEKINKSTGIPEKEIPSTYSFLIGVGLINRIDKGNNDHIEPSKRANAYYVTGSRDFFIRS